MAVKNKSNQRISIKINKAKISIDPMMNGMSCLDNFLMMASLMCHDSA